MGKSSTRERLVQSDTGRRDGHSGLLIPTMPGWSSAALAIAANRAYFIRFVPDEDLLAKIVSFNVTTASIAGDAIDLGFYDAAGTALWRMGAQTGWLSGSAVVKNVPISHQLFKAGIAYYAAMSFSAAGVSISGATSSGVANLFGYEQGVRGVTFKDTAHPLPADMSGVVAGVGGGIASVPILALKEGVAV